MSSSTPVKAPRHEGPSTSPSQPRTQGEARAGRGLDTCRRVQQVAAASSRAPPRPPALPPREPASWMSSSPISLCPPWNSRPQTSIGIHEPFAGARAGASGSRRWPRGGSRGWSLLPEAGRRRAAQRSRRPARCPRPASLWSTPPLGSRAAGLE